MSSSQKKHVHFDDGTLCSSNHLTAVLNSSDCKRCNYCVIEMVAYLVAKSEAGCPDAKRLVEKYRLSDNS